MAIPKDLFPKQLFVHAMPGFWTTYIGNAEPDAENGQPIAIYELKEVGTMVIEKKFKQP